MANDLQTKRRWLVSVLNAASEQMPVSVRAQRRGASASARSALGQGMQAINPMRKTAATAAH